MPDRVGPVPNIAEILVVRDVTDTLTQDGSFRSLPIAVPRNLAARDTRPPR